MNATNPATLLLLGMAGLLVRSVLHLAVWEPKDEQERKLISAKVLEAQRVQAEEEREEKKKALGVLVVMVLGVGREVTSRSAEALAKYQQTIDTFPKSTANQDAQKRMEALLRKPSV